MHAEGLVRQLDVDADVAHVVGGVWKRPLDPRVAVNVRRLKVSELRVM